jgi:hypothetical protein
MVASSLVIVFSLVEVWTARTDLPPCGRSIAIPGSTSQRDEGAFSSTIEAASLRKGDGYTNRYIKSINPQRNASRS